MNQLKQKIISKRHRLEKQNYIGQRHYYITICCYNRNNYFTTEKNVILVKDILFEYAAKYGFNLLIAMFMPDHLHLVLHGINDNSDLLKFINMFKKVSTYRFRFVAGNFQLPQNNVVGDFKSPKLWQEGFWDHIIRDERNLTKIIRYVLDNPVRKGLVTNFLDWKYVYSQEYDLKEFSNVFYDDEIKIEEW